MSPNDALIARAQTVESLARYYASRRDRVDALDPKVKLMGALEMEALASAELFVWKTDLLVAAAAAAQQLPTATLDTSVMPTPSGLYLFDKPFQFCGCDRPLAGLMWHPLAEDYSAFFLYVSTAATSWSAMGPLAAYTNFLFQHGASVQEAGSVDMRTGQGNDAFDFLNGAEHVIRFIVSSWLWLQQTIMAAAPRPVGGFVAKQAARLGIPSGVSVVHLRRMDAHRVDAVQSGGRDYSCQWLVRGHWRQQYYPSTGAHRPLWIEPYVKGPEDAPLKPPTQTVFAVTR